jgi:hypothetical protein
VVSGYQNLKEVINYLSLEKYLDLWSLNLNEGYWENIKLEKDNLNLKLKNRSGHSMSFDPVKKELIIFGGGCRKINNTLPIGLNDLMSFNTNTNTLKELFHDFTKYNGPDVNFSTTSFYDHKNKELIIFGGSFKNDKAELLTNNIWVYNFEIKKWTKAIKTNSIDYEALFYNNITSNKRTNDIDSDNILNIPCPRYAVTMSYSMKHNKGFIFGGNPNSKISNHPVRLNDLWSFELNKQTSLEVKNVVCLKIFETYFEELCGEGLIEQAVKVLNEYIYPLVTNSETRKQLSMLLITNTKLASKERYNKRNELYEELIKYFTNPLNNEEFLNR